MAKFYRSEDRTVLFELFGAGTSVENLKNLKANTTDAAVSYTHLIILLYHIKYEFVDLV